MSGLATIVFVHNSSLKMAAPLSNFFKKEKWLVVLGNDALLFHHRLVYLK